jgi:hypothetical protein
MRIFVHKCIKLEIILYQNIKILWQDHLIIMPDMELWNPLKNKVFIYNFSKGSRSRQL